MRLHSKTVLLTLLLPVILAGPACTVIESRQPCPCWATIEMERFRNLMGYEDVRTGIFTGGYLLESETAHLADYVTQPYEKALRDRVPTTVSAACGFEGMMFRSDTLFSNKGAETGRLWTASLTQDCDGDLAYFDLEPHKDYTAVKFVIVGIVSVDEFEYDMRVRANYNGLRLRDRKPVEGAYVAYPRPLEAGMMFEVRVPRQMDDEMVLDLLVPRDDRDYTLDDRVDVIPLGRKLVQQGFSWEKEDLDDAVVTIDVSRLDIGVIVSEWKEETFDENI